MFPKAFVLMLVLNQALCRSLREQATHKESESNANMARLLSNESKILSKRSRDFDSSYHDRAESSWPERKVHARAYLIKNVLDIYYRCIVDGKCKNRDEETLFEFVRSSKLIRNYFEQNGIQIEKKYEQHLPSLINSSLRKNKGLKDFLTIRF